MSESHDGSGEVVSTGPVTFGQRSLLRSLEHFADADQAAANMPVSFELPEGSEVAQVNRAWSAVVGAHPSLRTTFELGDDPRQLEHAGRAVELEVVELDQATLDDLRARVFDLERDLPWRLVIATVDGRPSGLVGTVHQIAADGGGLAVVEWDLRRALEGAALEPGLSPVDLATSQSGDGGERSLEFWVDAWKRFEPGAAASTLDESERQIAVLYSQEALASAARASDRTQTSIAAVMLAASALAIARMREVTHITIGLQAANRLSTAWAPIVTSMTQLAPVVLTLDEAITVDDFIRSAYRESMSAYVRAAYDVDALAARLRASGVESADPLTIDTTFNCAQRQGDVPLAEDPARYSTVVSSTGLHSGPRLSVIALVPNREGVLILVRASEAHMGRKALSSLCVAIESAMIEFAAERPARITDVPLNPARRIADPDGG